MARISADLGLDPGGLVDASGDLLEEIARAHRYRWTHGDELLALILERVDHLANLTAFIHTEKKKRPPRLPKPYRYPRPGPYVRPTASTFDEIRRFFRRR